MSRMGRIAYQHHSVYVLVVLLLLAAGLAVHTFVEDLVFLPGQAEAASSWAYLDELTHQDDLALSASLPDRFPFSWIEMAVVPVIQGQPLVFSPLRHPPRI